MSLLLPLGGSQNHLDWKNITYMILRHKIREEGRHAELHSALCQSDCMELLIQNLYLYM